MEKWLVDVQCQGCRGLFYRSAPNVIVTDADWPRNGDVVMGYEIPNTPGKLINFWSSGMALLLCSNLCYFYTHFLCTTKAGYDSKMATIYPCIVMTGRSNLFIKYPNELRLKTLK